MYVYVCIYVYRYDTNPEKLQAVIRQVYHWGVSCISIPGALPRLVGPVDLGRVDLITRPSVSLFTDKRERVCGHRPWATAYRFAYAVGSV